MGNFDVKFISDVSIQLKDTIFQVAYFRTRYFNNPWILHSPSTSMEGVENLGMDMPLSTPEVVYNIF